MLCLTHKISDRLRIQVGRVSGETTPQQPINPYAAIPNSVGINTQTDLRQIEAVSVHELRPGGNEVLHELLLVVILGINLGIGAQH